MEGNESITLKKEKKKVINRRVKRIAFINLLPKIQTKSNITWDSIGQLVKCKACVVVPKY